MSWPQPYHPITDGDVDTTATVQVYPHEPGGTDALAQWAGSTATVIINGGPCLILSTTRPVADRLVGLGDCVIDDGEHSVKALRGDRLGSSYRHAELDEAPPVDQ